MAAWAHEEVTGLNSGAVTLTVPANAVYAIVQADGGAVRYRLDGVPPTGTTGNLLADAGDPLILHDGDTLRNRARFIADGAGNPKLQVAYRINPADA